MDKNEITTYREFLFELQNMKDDEQNAYPQIADLLPDKDQIFELNLETRLVDLPQFLSVQYDHNAEIIYFKCPRYFENVDMTHTNCVIQYLNADKQPGFYYVPYYDISHYEYDDNDPDVETPLMLIPWAIGGLATRSAGTVTFNLRFYQFDENGDNYLINLNTRPQTAEVLHGMDLTDEVVYYYDEENNEWIKKAISEIWNDELSSDIVSQIYSDLRSAMQTATTYWVDASSLT